MCEFVFNDHNCVSISTSSASHFDASFEPGAELVKQAGLRQQYIDQSVSLNLAFPNEATPKWLNKVHMDAWKNGVKTLYYMRTESVLRGDIADKAMSEDCIACDG